MKGNIRIKIEFSQQKYFKIKRKMRFVNTLIGGQENMPPSLKSNLNNFVLLKSIYFVTLLKGSLEL